MQRSTGRSAISPEPAAGSAQPSQSDSPQRVPTSSTESLFESMEAMVEAVIALCDCDPDSTGEAHVSLDLIESHRLDVMGLDGLPVTPGGAT